MTVKRHQPNSIKDTTRPAGDAQPKLESTTEMRLSIGKTVADAALCLPAESLNTHNATP